MKGIKENPPPLISESKKGKRGRPRQSKAKTPQGADAFCRNRGGHFHNNEKCNVSNRFALCGA